MRAGVVVINSNGCRCLPVSSSPFDSVKIRVLKEGYDITKFHEEKWQGKDTYVIGAATPNERSN